MLEVWKYPHDWSDDESTCVPLVLHICRQREDELTPLLEVVCEQCELSLVCNLHDCLRPQLHIRAHQHSFVDILVEKLLIFVLTPHVEVLLH